MSSPDWQPAYILHMRAYRETSALLDVFCRDHGRIALIAKGVRGSKAQGLRAILQPFQPLFMTWRGRGELPVLAQVEAAGPSLHFSGKTLLSAFYLNELLLRLTSRSESHETLFWRYAECLGQLEQAGDGLAWELRRFERDLLQILGYELLLHEDADSQNPIEAGMHYHFDPESGPFRSLSIRPAINDTASRLVSGAALLALAQDVCPPLAQQRELQALMRRVLQHHLGGRELRSWAVLADMMSANRRA